MKIIEKLNNTNVGSVITDKTILSVFRRLGLIYDYSPWGYLESQWVYSQDEYYGGLYHTLTYSGPAITSGMLGSSESPYESREVLYGSKYGSSSVDFEYNGFKFTSVYLDGCFNAYLQLAAKPVISENEKVVTPRMSVFGTVI